MMNENDEKWKKHDRRTCINARENPFLKEEEKRKEKGSAPF